MQKGDFTPPEAVAPDLEPEVAAIINRAMQHDRGRALSERRRDAGRHRARAAHACSGPSGRPSSSAGWRELSAHDGQPSIRKAPERPDRRRRHRDRRARRARTSCCRIRRRCDEDEVIDGEAGRRWRSSRRRRRRAHAAVAPARGEHAALALPVPHDAETEQDGRPSQELSALPIPETEEPPGRRRKRSGGGLLQAAVRRRAAGRRRLGRRQVLPDHGSAAGEPATGGNRRERRRARAPAKPGRAPETQKPAPEAGRRRRRPERKPRAQAAGGRRLPDGKAAEEQGARRGRRQG